MLYLQFLSVQQLYRICTTYSDEDYNTSTVSEEVSAVDTEAVLFYCTSYRTNTVQSLNRTSLRYNH